jgi:hypothetical protein
VTSKNFEGLADISRYVDVETIESPFQTFDDDGCITFWYYLNTTAHQPKTTSAQIFVYLQYEDEEEKSLVWYIKINILPCNYYICKIDLTVVNQH